MVQRMPARPKRPKPRATVRPDPLLRSRARKILTRLAKAYPDWGPTLLFSSPLELLVATILAAQAQDERINQVTRVLFTKYRAPADYAAAPAGVLEQDIRATGFFNQKAKSLRAMARGLLEEFGGEVPSDMDRLTRLHGVGRKTASIVLERRLGSLRWPSTGMWRAWPSGSGSTARVRTSRRVSGRSTRRRTGSRSRGASFSMVAASAGRLRSARSVQSSTSARTRRRRRRCPRRCDPASQNCDS